MRVYLLTVIVLLLSYSTIVASELSDQSDGVEKQCGLQSLYYMCKLKQIDVKFDDLTRMKQSHPEGYSLSDLRDLAKSQGLSLDGIRVKTLSDLAGRPTILFLKQGNHGHFIVSRPVGHTGQLVQILDSTRQVRVVNFSDLVASQGWTGMGLSEESSWRTASIVSCVSGAILIMLCFLNYVRKRTISRRVARTI